jgi:hypothetical protein
MRKNLIALVALLSLSAFLSPVFADVTGDWNVNVTEQFKVKVKKQKDLNNTTQDSFSSVYSFSSDGTFKADGQSFGTWTQKKTKVDVFLDASTVINMLDDMLDDNIYGQTNITIQKTKFKTKESKDKTTIKGKYQVKANVDFVTLGTTGKVQLKGTFEGSKTLCIPTGNPDTNCDGIDDDCNGIPDDGYVPTPTTCGVGACASTGQMVCTDNGIANSCIPATPGTEGPVGDGTCSDAIDNDCDGTTDTTDSDCGEPKNVSIPDLSTGAGAVQIPVNVNDGTGIGGFQFTVEYDPAVLNCTDAVAGTLAPSPPWYLEVNPLPGQIIVLGLDLTETGASTGAGSLVELVCTAIGAAGSSTDMMITFSELSDLNGEIVSTTPGSGSVSIE